MEGAVVGGRSRLTVWSTGLAMFAMFFGAGNIVFPLALGQFAQDKNLYGTLGLIITAVLVPLTGLLAMMLYRGDYFAFFQRIGRVPGFLVILAILGLIGPFGGIPRCITISYSTLSALDVQVMQDIPLALFSACICILIFLFTYRPRRLLSLLGFILTPLLLLSLALIVIRGLWLMPELPVSLNTRWETFSQGLLDGYNTMDLLASFFFSSVVLTCLKKNKRENKEGILSTAVVGSLIAAVLLSLVYLSFSFLAAGYSRELAELAPDQLLGTLAHRLLGTQAALVASTAICFACFTTEIALTAVIAEFIHKTLFKEKVSYHLAIGATLTVSFLISTLNFNGISAFLVPIIQFCYPALIVLTLLNVVNKLYDYQQVKGLFYGTIALTLLGYLLIYSL